MFGRLSIELDKQFYKYVRTHGRVVSLGEYYVIQGCCRAEKLPSGRMAAPSDMIPQEDEKEYRLLIYQDIKVYIHHQLIKAYYAEKFSFWFAPLGEVTIKIE